jgi:hypothetical protein
MRVGHSPPGRGTTVVRDPAPVARRGRPFEIRPASGQCGRRRIPRSPGGAPPVAARSPENSPDHSPHRPPARADRYREWSPRISPPSTSTPAPGAPARNRTRGDQSRHHTDGLDIVTCTSRARDDGLGGRLRSPGQLRADRLVAGRQDVRDPRAEGGHVTPTERSTRARPQAVAGGEADGQLRGLVGAGRSRLPPASAMRARDVDQPTEEDVAEAERTLVLRRGQRSASRGEDRPPTSTSTASHSRPRGPDGRAHSPVGRVSHGHAREPDSRPH